jgi:purine-binding chemotaxis protein CheW
MSERKQFCTFYLDRRMFGIDVLNIQEVMRFQETTEVPLAPPVIRGLLNLRGSIVSTIDLRHRFGMCPLAGDALPMNIVTQTGTGLASFLVDRIGEVIEVDEASFEMPPETLSGEMRHLIGGVYKLEAGLLMILNVERVADLEGCQLAAASPADVVSR